MSKPNLVSIILAGGYSRRMGTDKALVKYDGIPAIDRIITQLRSFSKKIIIVTGTNHQRLSEHLTNSENIILINNPQPARGMFSSLQTAASLIDNAWIIIHLIDHPLISSRTYAALINALDDAHLVFKPTINRQKRCGHPIIINPEVLLLIKQADQEISLRDILSAIPGEKTKRIPVDDPHILDNFNYPENRLR